MRKRTILSIIITIICLVATNKFWFILNPIPVKFDIIGNDIARVEAQLNKKDDNDFKKYKYQTKKKFIDGENKVQLNVGRIKTAKRLRIVVKQKSPQPFEINNIFVKRYKINDYDKLKVTDAKTKISDNSIKITPQKTTTEITYTTPIKVKCSFYIDFRIFIIISVLTFLLAYKLTSYLADFKNIKNQSRLDIIFLTIFFVILFIPMSHIDDSLKAKKENRFLAKFPTFMNKDLKINQNYGKDFDSWFSDRFNLRALLIQTNTILECNLNVNFCGNRLATFDKQHNVIYTSLFWGIEPIKNDKPQILKNYATNVTKLNDYCKKNNIQLYFLVVPRQGDFLEISTVNDVLSKPDPIIEILEYLKNNTEAKIIFPREDMLEANKITPVYFKTDHHWTKKGAYVSYKALIKEIQKDFSNVPLLEEDTLIKYYDKRVSEHWDSKFNNGQTFKKLNVPESQAKKILDTEYLYYKNPNSKKLVPSQYTDLPVFDEKYDDLFYYPEGADKKVMVIANSFARNLVEFLPYSFKHTLRLYDNYRYMNFETYRPLIEEYKPDILILNFNSNYIHNLLNIYNTPNLEPKETEEK